MFDYYQNKFKVTNTRESNNFIRQILSLGENYLKFLLSKNKIYLPDYLDTMDVSVDLLAELFKVENCVFVRIRDFYDENYQDGISNEKDFELSLRAFIYSVIQNNLASLYKSSDPFTYNIFRNIKEAVKKLNYFTSVHFSDKFIHTKEKIDFTRDFPEKEDLLNIIYKNKINCHLNNITEFLRELFNAIAQDEMHYEFVKFNDLVYVIKSIFSNNFLSKKDGLPENESITEFVNIKFILHDVKLSFSEKLNKYTVKNGLSKNFSECMYNIIEEVINDYSFGNGRKSVMELMKLHFKKEETNLFNKVQYCIEMFESELVKNFNSEKNLIER